LLLVALLLPNDAAWAHAVLLATTPAANSSLPQSPAAIELAFDEPVQLLALRLLDSTGRDVTPATSPAVADGHVAWALPAPLPTGRYLVSWRMGSLDGHVVSGSFAFAIGEAILTPAPAGSSVIDAWQWPGFILHAASRILVLLSAGAALFRLLLKPAAELLPALRRRERRLALLGFLAQLLLIGAHGAMRAGLSIDGLWMPAAWQAALAAPSAWPDGLSLLGLLVLAFTPPRRALAPPIEGAAALLALASFADGGHALAVLPQVQGQALMLLHGLAAALWIGAFDPLRRAFARDSGAATARLFARFQKLGFGAVLAVVASGGTMAWLLIPRWSDLWRSLYGVTLSAKLLAVLIMLAIAGLNRFWLTPRALVEETAMKRRLLLVLRLDLAVALIAVLLAVGLSLGPPPVASRIVELTDAKYAITLTLSPGHAGDNSAQIRIAMPDGMPIDPQKVQIRAESPAAGIEPSIFDAQQIAPGLYRIADLPLWSAGTWKLRINLMIDDFTMVSRDLDLTLSR
jgi:copper transport protein